MGDVLKDIAARLERSGVDPAFMVGFRAAISHPRYEARKMLPTPEHPERWGVMDTFTQAWVEGEWSTLRAWVEKRAVALSHAYERTL